MIKAYFRPDEPTEPYFLLRAYDLGRIEVLMETIREESMDLTEIEEANRSANKIIEKIHTIKRLLEVEKPTIEYAHPGQGDEA